MDGWGIQHVEQDMHSLHGHYSFNFLITRHDMINILVQCTVHPIHYILCEELIC